MTYDETLAGRVCETVDSTIAFLGSGAKGHVNDEAIRVTGNVAMGHFNQYFQAEMRAKNPKPSP